MKIYMELRGAAGGQEADLFAEELSIMYMKFAKKIILIMKLLMTAKQE